MAFSYHFLVHLVAFERHAVLVKHSCSTDQCSTGMAPAWELTEHNLSAMEKHGQKQTYLHFSKNGWNRSTGKNGAITSKNGALTDKNGAVRKFKNQKIPEETGNMVENLDMLAEGCLNLFTCLQFRTYVTLLLVCSNSHIQIWILNWIWQHWAPLPWNFQQMATARVVNTIPKGCVVPHVIVGEASK